MPRMEIDDFITDYERAMCYFTFPKISYIISPGVVFLYTLLIILSFSILFVGIAYDNLTIANLGGILAIIVAAGGVLVLVGRTVVYEYRWRKYLEGANNIPQQIASELPDPFQNHTLICISVETRDSNLFPCIDRSGEVIFFVEEVEKDRKWIIKSPQDIEIAKIEGKSSLFTFVISYKLPLKLRVYEGENLSYLVKPKWSLFNINFIVSDYKQTPNVHYIILDTGIFLNKKLIGRFYQLRKFFYLDVEQPHFNLGLLALLIYLSK